MARAYKNPSIVSGISINDILSLDPKVFDLMSPKERREVTSRLVSAGNKRISRMNQRGDLEKSGAYQALKKSGRSKLSIKGKSDDEVKQEFNAARNFLRNKSSSMAELARLTKENAQGESYGEFRRSIINRIYEQYPPEVWANLGYEFYNGEVEGSNRTLEDVMRDMFNSGASVDEVHDEISKIVQRMYEQMKEGTANVEEGFTNSASFR